MAPTDIFIIILNWNNYDDTRRCVNSIQKNSYDDPEILVIDNGSTDGSAQRIKKNIKNVHTLFLDENLGWAGGNNRGIKYALNRDAKFIFLLNNDTVYPENEPLLEKLTSHVESNASVLATTPVIYKYPEKSEVWFNHGSISYWTGKLSKTWPHVEGDIKRNQHIAASSILLSRKTIEEVGYLDESYFLIGSDTEYSHRVRERGFEITTVADVGIYHEGSQSADVSELSYYMARNRFRMLTFLNVFRPTAYSYYVVWIIWTTLIRLANQDFESVQDLIIGICDGLRGVTGKKEEVDLQE